MEATCGTTLQFSSPWIGSEKIERRLNGFLRVSQRYRKDYRLKSVHFTELQWRSKSTRRGRVSSSVSHACKNSQAPALQPGNFHSFDGNWLLKKKGEEVASCLNGRCIFLVGMMGSGKTTVGKVLSEALAYSFVDSDKYVEESMCGSPVAQIFKKFGESFFRDYESEALRNLSLVPRQVVATGGGAVIRPINWEYMKQGVTVYLDVPLDALARRIAAVGTGSRPLLDFESGDAYTKAFMGLFTLSKKRGRVYANADATVSLQYIAAELGLENISDITPTAIALEQRETSTFRSDQLANEVPVAVNLVGAQILQKKEVAFPEQMQIDRGFVRLPLSSFSDSGMDWPPQCPCRSFHSLEALITIAQASAMFSGS